MLLRDMPRTSAEIAALEEPRQAGLLAAVTPLTRAFAGGVMGFHAPGSWQNQACGVGLEGPVSGDEIDAMVHFFTSRGVEPRIELSPFAHETLVAGLGARGFVVREFENVLARELPEGEDLEATLPNGRPRDLVVWQLDPTDERGLREAVETTLSGFYPPGEIPDAMIVAGTKTLTVESMVCYVAALDGQTVAAGSVGIGTRVASLMGVSTHPDFRRRGIQQYLMTTRLQTARARGCVLATIASRPGISTERNAMRIGFHMAYTRTVVAMPGPGLIPSP